MACLNILNRRGGAADRTAFVVSPSKWGVARAMLPLWLAAVVFIPLYGSPPTITLHVIDARSGKPLKGIKVEMFTSDAGSSVKPEEPKTKPNKTQEATTDNDGRAVFELFEPLPESVGFLLVPPDDFASCWGQLFSAKEVLESGAVADFAPRCGKLKWKASAKPGEVLIFEKRLTTWEKMRREMP